MSYISQPDTVSLEQCKTLYQQILRTLHTGEDHPYRLRAFELWETIHDGFLLLKAQLRQAQNTVRSDVNHDGDPEAALYLTQLSQLEGALIQDSFPRGTPLDGHAAFSDGGYQIGHRLSRIMNDIAQAARELMRMETELAERAGASNLETTRSNNSNGSSNVDFLQDSFDVTNSKHSNQSINLDGDKTNDSLVNSSLRRGLLGNFRKKIADLRKREYSFDTYELPESPAFQDIERSVNELFQILHQEYAELENLPPEKNFDEQAAAFLQRLQAAGEELQGLSEEWIATYQELA